MLIVPSLLFAISFLTWQVAVFAAPLPLNYLSINARSVHESAGHANMSPKDTPPGSSTVPTFTFSRTSPSPDGTVVAETPYSNSWRYHDTLGPARSIPRTKSTDDLHLSVNTVKAPGLRRANSLRDPRTAKRVLEGESLNVQERILLAMVDSQVPDRQWVPKARPVTRHKSTGHVQGSHLKGGYFNSDRIESRPRRDSWPRDKFTRPYPDLTEHQSLPLLHNPSEEKYTGYRETHDLQPLPKTSGRMPHPININGVYNTGSVRV